MNRIVTTYCTSCWIPAVVHVVSFIVASSYSLNGAIVATNYLYRAEMLAYAIPSESYAVGANPLPTLSAEDLNVNMADFSDGQGDLPENGQRIQDKHRNWQHSTFVQRSYKRTHQLFDQLINFIKENSHE